MKIGINARVLSSPSLRGWNRYTLNLIMALGDEGADLVLYSDGQLSDVHTARLPADRCEIKVAPPMRYPAWEQSWLPRQCVGDHVEVLHCPVNFGLPWRRPCPTVLTLHDTIDVANPPPVRRRLTPSALVTNAYHWVARTRASHIITPSAYSRDDLIRYLRLSPERITVVHEAADPRFRGPVSGEARTGVRTRYELTRPYVFYVGGWEGRKNVPFLVRAFGAAQLSDTDLLLAGGTQPQIGEMTALAKSLGIANSVRLVAAVPDEDLPALYAEALCFVYPSVYEGFGLQLCESMAVGCPTLACRATSLPEVLGNGGDTFQGDDPGELTDLLQRVAHNGSYRDSLAERAERRGREFSWKHTAKETLRVYGTLVGAR
jgi:glycosyltransferase involved in cell wall biosynthesis